MAATLGEHANREMAVAQVWEWLCDKEPLPQPEEIAAQQTAGAAPVKNRRLRVVTGSAK